MIRKLREEDNSKLMELIMKEPEYNVYTIGNVERFGYDKSFYELLGEFNEEGYLTAILARYFNSFNFYAKDSFDLCGFADVIKKYDKMRLLVGKTSIVSKFEETALRLNKAEPQHFLILKKINSSFKIDEKIIVKKAQIENVEAIVNLRERIEEFQSGINDFKEKLTNEFEAGSSQGYYIEANDKIVSFARTTSESSRSAMLVDVMTDKEYRKKGMISACLKALCENLIKQRKTICLFYNNVEAGNIYRKIGFEEIGLWSIYMRIERL
jgi:predicted GNAT family acetyltransferase